MKWLRPMRQKGVESRAQCPFGGQLLQDVSGAYNAVFNSVLKTGKRTSMIIDPPDGKIPPLVARAQQRQARSGGAGAGRRRGRRGTRQARTITPRPPRNRRAVSAFRCRSFR